MPTTLAQVFNSPDEFSYAITLPSAGLAILRPLKPDDVKALAELLVGFGPETRKFYLYESFDLAMAKSLCADINKYDKLRFVLELVATKKIIGLFEFSMDLTEDDLERFKGYGYQLQPELVCRFGPVVADQYQGQGVAKLVFEYIKKIAKLFGKKSIILYGGVHADNQRALKFYAKVGFQNAGRFINQDGVECADMILVLSDSAVRFRTLKIIAGFLLIIVGIIGIILPVMPGWVFVFSGLALIFPEKGKLYAQKFKHKVRSISKYFK